MTTSGTLVEGRKSVSIQRRRAVQGKIRANIFAGPTGGKKGEKAFRISAEKEQRGSPPPARSEQNTVRYAYHEGRKGKEHFIPVRLRKGEKGHVQDTFTTISLRRNISSERRLR